MQLLDFQVLFYSLIFSLELQDLTLRGTRELNAFVQIHQEPATETKLQVIHCARWKMNGALGEMQE